MVSKKLYNIFNFTLVLIAILLVMNLFNVQLPSLGRVFYAVDDSPHLCGVDNQGIVLHPDLDRCCFEARNLAKCNSDPFLSETGKFDVSCKNSEYTPSIRLNNKAYQYCVGTDIWI